ncbi:DNA annealing helicase and endonuclease ZRANB3 isoform X5 [Vombatus ursinus]|uniref:DNA annealing helicase and endonuclease ZRANB3 isoform X5 n=1 Tax=Vombatus ursinus TaxID=29139 RepID=UPI000FFD57D8|nr:DNA annealing helicase and endonuclease ZRANB3 isoform X5 [Vombatus ursinus]
MVDRYRPPLLPPRLNMNNISSTQESLMPKNSCLKSEFEDQLLFLPEKLRARLLPFQKDGITFALRRNGRCMIADEMGLGKTIQAVAIAYFYKNEWPLLIVVPSSLRYPWTEEIEKWVPELGPQEIVIIQNKTDVGRISTSKVTVLGYGLLTTDAKLLIDTLYKQNFEVIIIDESHYMKSRNASRSKILLPLVQKSRRAILLTGTPALGRPEELFMQIDALFPKQFGTWTEYAKRYCNAHVRYFGKRAQWDSRGASNLGELHQLLSNIMIRRLKTEVLTQLPPKIRQRVPFDLPSAAAKELNTSFEEWEKLMRAPHSGATETGSHFFQAMGLMTRMFKQTAIAKAGAAKDYIKMMLQNDSLKFLVFAHHLSMLQACTEAVIESKVRYIRIDGSVPSSERIYLVNQFQKDPDTRVAILSIQAAGQGLTFTAATHVIFAELYWDPGHIKQAEDRAHRIGQCSSVNIHYLIANGTLDTLMWGMLNRKAIVTGSTLNGRKEKLEAEEGDKEKWDFLKFAEAWTPNENFEEIRNEVLFTHFEKEKQHDIRAFFLPKHNKKRHTMASCDESNVLQEKDTEKALDCRNIATRDAIDYGSDFEPEVHLNKQQIDDPNCIQDEKGNQVNESQNSALQVKTNSSCAQVLEQSAVEQFVESKREKAESENEGGDGPKPQKEELKDSDTLPVYDVLMFCASKNTDRIHLYTKNGEQMNCNFIPLDVKLDLWEDLPACFQLKQNRSLILKFVREWNCLTAMKQRIIRRSGHIFHSPILALDEITKQQTKQNSTKRYITKEDVAAAAVNKVQSDGGSIRVITKEFRFSSKNQTSSAVETWETTINPVQGDLTTQPSTSKGFLQAVDIEGNPLCLHCQQRTCQSGQQYKVSAWDSRFCSQKCQEEFWIRSNNSYLRAKVFEIEHGVCQLCNLNAQELFLSLRDAPKNQRKNLLQTTWISKLSIEQLNEMMINPVEGQFWQVDHVRPVYSGGGQCALENLQTLCTVCHKEKTAKQAKERSQEKRKSLASKHGSDITRFFIKK